MRLPPNTFRLSRSIWVRLAKADINANIAFKAGDSCSIYAGSFLEILREDPELGIMARFISEGMAAGAECPGNATVWIDPRDLPGITAQ